MRVYTRDNALEQQPLMGLNNVMKTGRRRRTGEQRISSASAQFTEDGIHTHSCRSLEYQCHFWARRISL